MEKFYTPMRTSAKSRRRALSPIDPMAQSGSSFSSPYDIGRLEMNEDELRAHISDQDNTIRELRSTIKYMENGMKSKMNESILIETSNRISANESRIFQKDIALHEQELRDMKESLRNAKLELTSEMGRRVAAEDNLKRRAIEIEELEHKLKTANDVTSRLQERLADKDQTITQLGSDVSAARFEISMLEARLKKSRDDLEDAKMRNRTLSLEISTLKAALADCKEELRRSLDDVKDERENMTKREIDLRRSLESNLVSHNISTSRNLMNAFQCLSSQIVTIQRTQLPTEQLADVQHRIGELTATNKFLEGSVMEYKEKIDDLSKKLVKAQENSESAKSELAELQKKLVEVEGSSSLMHKFLLEESNKIKQQKADLRCELLELRRDYNKQKDKLVMLEANKMDDEELNKLRSELESCRLREDDFKKAETHLLEQLRVAEEKVRELEECLSSMRRDAADLSVEKDINRELREELKKAEAKVIELANTLEIVDSQCEQFRELKKQAEMSKQKAANECSTITAKLREVEKELERQRASEVEVVQLRAEKERLEMKIRYLNDELRETHNDYRSELAQLARQISETKQKDLNDSELYNVKIGELRTQIAQMDSTAHAAERKLEELQRENQTLQEQVSACTARELETSNENRRLRSGLAEAVAKIEQYKREAEDTKETCKEMAEQLGMNEERISKLEEDVLNLEETLREKEKLEAYLQSQIKSKDMPKLSRRSTLLRTTTESSLEMIDPVVVEELENQKTNLLKELEQKKKELMSRKMAPFASSRYHESKASAPLIDRQPLAELQSRSAVDIRNKFHQNKPSTLTFANPHSATMRHDIPHRWTELRHFGLFSIKCAVCFVGVPTTSSNSIYFKEESDWLSSIVALATDILRLSFSAESENFTSNYFAKKKRCTHCGIIVHSQCASRVVNTCGLPGQCANYYLDSQSASSGKMNGWIRLFSDDSTVREWISVWGEMDEKCLMFYDNDSTQSDMRTPFMTIDLEKELRIVRVGSDVPVKAENEQMSNNIVHLRTKSRNIYILAPSTQTAKRWAEALQSASTRRMMLTRRPSSFSDQSCLLVLSKPNNLTIHTVCVIDNYLLIGAQSGLFFTHISSPRLPVRIGGFSSISAMELLQCLNILALVIDHRRFLALVPLCALKFELNATQPYLRADVIPGYENLHVLTYHEQEGQRYLFAASSTKINVLKYNAARDVFMAHQVIETNEPAVCLQSTPHGVYFGSDTFYFIQVGRGELDPICVADSSIEDYPIALFSIREEEVLLAYQNYGLFVNSQGKRTRNKTVEWEQMPMEFAYTAPYLYVVHYDSIEIMRIADYNGLDSDTVLDERELYECQNAHVVHSCPNGDVFISVSNTECVEVHRFNAIHSRRSTTKRKGLASVGFDKRSKVAL